MPLVMNATSRPVSVCVFGNWFTFTEYGKPGAIKLMDENKVFFLTSRKAELGFVGLPESMESMEFRATPEGIAVLAKARAEGVAKRIQKLEEIKRNELVSLSRDLEMNNIKVDPRVLMPAAVVEHLKELAEYQTNSQDEAAKRVAEIQELEAKISGSTQGM